MLTSFFLFHFSPIIYHSILCGILGLEYYLGRKKPLGAGSTLELLVACSLIVFFKIVEVREKLKQGDKK